MGQSHKVQGTIRADAWPHFEALRHDAEVRSTPGSFAGELLTLVSTCYALSGLDWNSFRNRLPGYQRLRSMEDSGAMARIRDALAAEQSRPTTTKKIKM